MRQILFILLAFWSFANAKGDVEKIGDTLVIAVPVAAFAYSMYQKDFIGGGRN